MPRSHQRRNRPLSRDAEAHVVQHGTDHQCRHADAGGQPEADEPQAGDDPDSRGDLDDAEEPVALPLDREVLSALAYRPVAR